MKSKLALDRWIAILAIAGLAFVALPGSVDPVGAKSRDAKRDDGRAQGPGVPLLAIVSLSDQRVTIYDAEGKMLQSPVSEIMTRKVVSCGQNETIAEIMGRMTAGKFRHVPVVEQGRLIGIVSIGDIVKARLEERRGW